MSLRITKNSIQINIVGYLKTVGYGGNIDTFYTTDGRFYLHERQKKFFGVAMADFKYYLTDREKNPSSLKDMNIVVSVWFDTNFKNISA